MGRWSPPPAKSSPYITPQGFETLQAELDDLWVRRRDVVKALSAAAAEGDRSENAEYIYRKKELAGLDRRIRYLQRRLPELTIVREHPATDVVFFGALVELEDEAGATSSYRIVGPDEAVAEDNLISIDAPLARALLKKAVGDEIVVDADGKNKDYLIRRVSYPDVS